jgi:hypothetical protein
MTPPLGLEDHASWRCPTTAPASTCHPPALRQPVPPPVTAGRHPAPGQMQAPGVTPEAAQPAQEHAAAVLEVPGAMPAGRRLA